VTTHTPRARLVRNSGVLRRADEIIDAAARVFAERGYHGTTTQAIADVLGMRQASLYYYFPSKEAALEEVCARGTDDFVKGAERVMQMDVPPLAKLKLLIASHLAPIEFGKPSDRGSGFCFSRHDKAGYAVVDNLRHRA